MIIRRPSAARGGFDFGWLKTQHSFSFGDYYDPNHMGFRALRVINEDVIAPATGFGEHGHRDMEIITVMLSGILTHGDSIGNHEPLKAGEVQRMTAGRAVRHSEWNASPDTPAHLLQIWLLPSEKSLPPSYEQRAFPTVSAPGLHLLVSGRGKPGVLTMHQDADLYRATLPAGETLTHPLDPERHAWVQVISGRLTVNGQAAEAGDGFALSDEAAVTLHGTSDADALVFDLA